MAKSQDNEKWLQYSIEKFEESRNWRSENVELQWFVNSMYYKGYQNLKWDRDRGAFVKDARNPLAFYINHTYMVCRAIRNAVNRTNPHWDVDALPYGTLDADTSRILGEFLAFEYQKLNLGEKNNKAVLFGLLYGLGIYQYGYDANLDNGEGNVWIETLDPFDTYIDPFCTRIEDARYIDKVMVKPYELIKDNPNYDKKGLDEIQSTNKQSESSYKSLILNTEGNTDGGSNNVILHETWVRSKEGIRVITRCENTILRNELTDFEKLPFEIYQPDINLNSIYGEGWVKNIVPINKAINYLETSRLEYNVLINKGRMLIPKGSGIKSVTNQNGEKIYYKPGFTPQFLPTPAMGNDINNQLNMLNNYMQTIGAANEAFIGQTPTGVKSGVAIQTLIGSNANQLYDLENNLATTLAKLGEDILKMGYKYQLLSKPFRTSTGDYYKIIGGGASPEDIQNFYTNIDKTIKTISIPENPEVTVDITSGAAHTKEALRDTYRELRQTGDLSRQTLWENVGIDTKQEDERIQKEKTEVQAQQPQTQPGMGINPNAQLPEGMQLNV